MRLVFLTQVVDADHPALAQTLDLIDALARRADAVTVICDRVGRHELPGNVRLQTFGAPSRLRRGFRFERALSSELLARPRPDAVISHMIPVFATLAAPLARARRIPLLLWYTHWNADRSLRIALRLVDRVLSVDRRSFPVDTPKLVATGHAIDVERFSPGSARSSEAAASFRLLALGRFARWKGYDTLLAAFALAQEDGLAATLELRGPALTRDEEEHRAELERTIAARASLRANVVLDGPLSRDSIPALMQAADAFVSPTQPERAETLDKVVYEAAACGTPVISSNAALREFLGGLPVDLLVPRRDPRALASAIERLAALSAEQRDAVGAALRARVVEGHSVESWADAVMRIAAETRGT